jgi:hypothetical protein
MKKHKILHFDSRKQKNEFCRISTPRGRMLPNGNIKPFGIKELFGCEQYTFAISGMEQQQICRKIIFCRLTSGR